jgi:HlyD family secretion protein
MSRWIKRVVIVVALVLVVAFAAGWYLRRGNGDAVNYRTATVTRGDLVATIGATGTLEPEEVVDVGAQVTAQIVSFGTDTNGKPIDYGSMVEEGMELARLDDVVYAASVTEAQAQLAQSRASVLRAKADEDAARARLYSAQRDWDRAERIGPGDALSRTAYDNYKSAFEQAKANVAVAAAAVTVAQAAVDQSESAVKRAERNLGFTVIKSPVKGTVIDRRVNIGQTVTSNLNVASLFLIARDLRRMEVWVFVNEADIGQVRPGQAVTFTVDAFPGETFRGEVSTIRLNAQMTQNVVTYPVVVTTDNSNGKLLPYLTANVKFEASRRDDVLMVPNAALRWAPASAAAPASAGGGGPRGGGGGGGGERGGADRGGGERGGGGRGGRGASDGGTVWVRDGEAGVKPVQVQVGLTDGTNTEVSGEGLAEGLEVITGELSAAAGGPAGGAPGTPKNPFIPQMPRRR